MPCTPSELFGLFLQKSSVAVCCSVLQCVVVCRSVLQCAAVCCRIRKMASIELQLDLRSSKASMSTCPCKVVVRMCGNAEAGPYI